MDSESAFTLVEILLATALVAVIAAMVFGSLHLSTAAIDGARRSASREQLLRSTLRIISEEMSEAVSTNMGPMMGVNAVQEGQPADANDPADDGVNIYPLGEMNTSDGAEFIDDNIRMKPQPYHYSGEPE